MIFPPELVETLRARLPLSGVIGRRLTLTRIGNEYKACCPFHKEKTPSFYVNDAKQFFHCFGCGAHGDVIGFTMRYLRLSFPAAVEQLAAEAGIEIPRDVARDTPVQRERFEHSKRLALIQDAARQWFSEQLALPHGREARAWITARGIKEPTVAAFGLGYAPRDGALLVKHLTAQGFTVAEMQASGLARLLGEGEASSLRSFFRNRVIFPVGDRRGRVVAFGGRVLGDGEPKYLNSPDHELFRKGQLLYGLSRARGERPRGQPIIVVEGYMDVISLVQAGWIGAVAPLGTAVTEDQLRLLWALTAGKDNDSPILCFDGDAAGKRAAARAIARALPMLEADKTLRVAFLPSGEDPDSLINKQGTRAMAEVIERAWTLPDALWHLAMEDINDKTPEARARAVGKLRKDVASIGDPTLRAFYDDEMRVRVAAFRASLRGGNVAAASSGSGGQQGWRKNPYAQGRNAFAASFNNSSLRKQAPQRQQQIEWDIITLMLYYPEVAEDFAETFAAVQFANAPRRALRDHMMDVMISSPQDSHAALLARLQADMAATHATDSGGRADARESAALWQEELQRIMNDKDALQKLPRNAQKARATAERLCAALIEEQVRRHQNDALRQAVIAQ